MAKPAYPGLVVVPPSDRRIFRRRLVRWSFLIIAVTSCASAITVWLPSSGNQADCQTVIDNGVSRDVREECGEPGQSVTEALSRQSESAVIEVSRRVGQAESDSHVVMAASDPGELMTEPNRSHTSMAHPDGPAKGSSDRTMASPHRDGSATDPPTNKPASSPDPDIRLAEQGDAFAQYRLGRFFAQRGGSHARESLTWYTKASEGLRRLAEAGNGEAMYVLGVMNAFGRGVAKDHDQARRWLTQAVERQVAAARPVLASLERHRDAEPKLQASVQVQRVRHDN